MYASFKMNGVQDKPELSAAQPTSPLTSNVNHPLEHSTQPVTAPEEIEEGRAAYRPGGLHPVFIGDIFDDRFKVLSKIGYGRYSTVWLVRDLQAK